MRIEFDSLWAFTEKTSWLRSLLVDDIPLPDRERINVGAEPMTPQEVGEFLQFLQRSSSPSPAVVAERAKGHFHRSANARATATLTMLIANL